MPNSSKSKKAIAKGLFFIVVGVALCLIELFVPVVFPWPVFVGLIGGGACIVVGIIEIAY